MIDKFRKKYPVFIYKSYRTELTKGGLKISFSFRTEPNIKFTPKVLIREVTKEKLASLDKSVVDNFAFHLGLMEIPSYWKATCSPEIVVEAGSLDDYQTEWWRDLILRGLGQFFYENKIDFTNKDFVEISSKNGQSSPRLIGEVKGDKTLVPVGGGKDSAVTLDMLSKNFSGIGAFVLNAIPASIAITNLAKVTDVVSVDRAIDKKLLELNAKGFLNGHTPFSAYLAFLATFVAYLFDYKNISLSNEKSADEGNVDYKGMEINHQYSKTFEFENKFREYNQRYLSNINYFSFLRPLYEIQIAKLFSKMERYFDVIRSCNVGQATNSWCCVCPKCLSTFILLYPFLEPQKIMRVFPQNLYEDRSLALLLDSLISKDKVKPFECVGTREEFKVALFLSAQNRKPLPPLLDIARRKFLTKERGLERRAQKVLDNWDKDNNLNKKFESILRKVL
ncbi:hypothetical protein IID22_02390 [Patescibacteria group bacterium]|nr:hypothetical protein [Patescibacteria group bacterium]